MEQQLRTRDEEHQEESDCHHDNSDGNNNNNNRRKTVCPGVGEHPLQYNYTFWYSRRTPSRPASSLSYEQNIRQIGTVASVEQFWRFYSHLVRPGDLSGHSDFHLFKEGIKPMWEVLCSSTCLLLLPYLCSSSLISAPPQPVCSSSTCLLLLPYLCPSSTLPCRTSVTAAGGSGSSGCVKAWPAGSGRTSCWPCWGSSSWWGRRSVEPWCPSASRRTSCPSGTGRPTITPPRPESETL
uniref:Eukaryotic translation initiation factor 4E type 2-like n=1 Tax=Salarias fasciatus TaxID=181472 RepID=A0A672GFH6_SALFA